MRDHFVRRALAALALTIVVGGTAFGTAFSIDQSDLWWNPTENGWGIQFVQTGSSIVATMYVYGLSGQPVWYIAVLEAQPTADTWSGDMFVGTGPWFGTTPFDPAAVAGRKVGTMTWTASTLETGTLTYAADGTAVTRTLHRLSLRNDDHNGTYQGSLTKMIVCSDSLALVESDFVAFDVVQGANTLTVKPSYDYFITNCTYVGDYAQMGHYGSSRGTFTCEDGSNGTHQFTQITVQRIGWARVWTARLTGTDNSGCVIDAHVMGSGILVPEAR